MSRLQHLARLLSRAVAACLSTAIVLLLYFIVLMRGRWLPWRDL
jgi:hypothetical protein